MEPGIDIRRRPDGSIDIDHYARIARADRIAAARRCSRTVADAAKRLLWLSVAKRAAIRGILRVAR